MCSRMGSVGGGRWTRGNKHRDANAVAPTVARDSVILRLEFWNRYLRRSAAVESQTSRQETGHQGYQGARSARISPCYTRVYNGSATHAIHIPGHRRRCCAVSSVCVSPFLLLFLLLLPLIVSPLWLSSLDTGVRTHARCVHMHTYTHYTGTYISPYISGTLPAPSCPPFPSTGRNLVRLWSGESN